MHKKITNEIHGEMGNLQKDRTWNRLLTKLCKLKYSKKQIKMIIKLSFPCLKKKIKIGLKLQQ